MKPAVTVPSTFACLVTLAFVDVHARVFGLRRTLKLAARVVRPPSRETDATLVAATARRVATAAAFYPRRARCLEQSLALYMLLRRRGAAAELRLGANPRPFFAHAWVEVDGEPVAEQGDLPLNLTVFPALEVQ